MHQLTSANCYPRLCVVVHTNNANVHKLAGFLLAFQVCDLLV